MKSQRIGRILSLFAGVMMIAAGTGTSRAAEATDTKVPVTMTVTANITAGKRAPEISADDLVVKQGKSQLKVTEWVPARGDRAGLELFIVIDDRSDAQLSLQYDSLRAFINGQPASALIGVGFMRNATVQIAQDLTANHDLAAQALRLPSGNPGAYGSPYLSVVDLMKRWPVSPNRREVLMFTSGIGRDRHHFWHRGYWMDADVDTASAVAQRTGTNIFSIYTRNSAAYRTGYWDGTNGQLNLSRLSDRTGGASFYLGLHNPVSIEPYLGELGRIFDHQYLLSFDAESGKKSGLQTISLSTPVAGVDLAAHDAVWVAGAE
jgi:hypothetical protein